MQAWAGLHAHPRADLEGAVDALRTIFGDSLAEIPYLTGGKRGDDMRQAERMEAVERYRAYKRSVLGDQPLAPAQQNMRPMPARKHK